MLSPEPGLVTQHRREPPAEGPDRRPRQADQVLVVGADAPVEDGVGRVRGVAGVRRRVGEHVVEERAERRIVGDLDAVAACALDRRPPEGRLELDQGAIRRSRLRRRVDCFWKLGGDASSGLPAASDPFMPIAGRTAQ